MRQCNHSDVRLFSDAPVVDVDTGCEGQAVRILCRGNLADVILNMKLLTRSLPQNATSLQPTAVAPQPTAHAVRVAYERGAEILRWGWIWRQ